MHFKKACYAVSFAVLLALFLVITKSPTSFAATSTSLKNIMPAAITQSGYTTGVTNVRSAPNMTSTLVIVYPANKRVTVYGSVLGQAINDNNTWYRVSSAGAAPLYAFSGLVVITTDNGDNSAPTVSGKEVVVSLSHQWLHAYQNGREVYNTPIMSGRPALATPTGTYHVFIKQSPTTFYSPFPPGSPYWYPPTHINYALEWKGGGFFLHDSYWHSVYGPGTNTWHYDPVDGWQEGSHGCVAMPITAASWLYSWAPIGTTVQINA